MFFSYGGHLCCVFLLFKHKITHHCLVFGDGGHHGQLVAQDPVLAPRPVAEPGGVCLGGNISDDNISPYSLQGVDHVTYQGGQLAQINIKNNFNFDINATNCL